MAGRMAKRRAILSDPRTGGTGIGGIRTVAAFLGMAMLGALPSCTQTASILPNVSDPQAAGPRAPAFAEFTDMPVPAGAIMDLERSLVLGGRAAWIGRLVLGTEDTAPGMYDFYQAEMPKFGWEEITTVRAVTSVLTYARGDRVATIQIARDRLGGATVSIVVSPRGMSAQGS